jgi:enterochelin esterase family protein
VLSGIGTYVDLAGGHLYPEKVMASEREPIRIFMIDGRNDNRGVNAAGTYDPTRDWFYQTSGSRTRSPRRVTT